MQQQQHQHQLQQLKEKIKTPRRLHEKEEEKKSRKRLMINWSPPRDFIRPPQHGLTVHSRGLRMDSSRTVASSIILEATRGKRRRRRRTTMKAASREQEENDARKKKEGLEERSRRVGNVQIESDRRVFPGTRTAVVTPLIIYYHFLPCRPLVVVAV